MRAEFAVLTGIEEAALGYDRFNPYHALSRRRITSQVWRLRAAGYRTICLHPYDRWFFRRDLAMPALGFETFLGRETLGGSRTPPYLPDSELARHILHILDAEGPAPSFSRSQWAITGLGWGKARSGNAISTGYGDRTRCFVS